MGKSRKIADTQMPRRASRRLAGIPLDPAPEPKTTNRARKGVVKKSSDTVKKDGEFSSSDEVGNDLVAKPAVGTLKGTKRLLDSNNSKHQSPSVGNPNEVTAKESHEKQSTVMTLPHTKAMSESNKKIKTTTNNEKRAGLPLDLPLGELWEDPCIAFAIKTLTGVPDDNPDGMKRLSESRNNEFGGSAALEECARKGNTGNGEGEKQMQSAVFSLGNISIPEEQYMGEAESSDKSDGKPGSITDLSFTEVFADPCIEFAVKTLTGAIPLDYSMVIQDYLPQQVLSFQQHVNSGIASQNITEYHQNELAYQQFGTMQMPSFNQPSMIQPAFSKRRNPGISYSTATSHGYGHVGDRSNKFQM